MSKNQRAKSVTFKENMLVCPSEGCKHVGLTRLGKRDGDTYYSCPSCGRYHQLNTSTTSLPVWIDSRDRAYSPFTKDVIND